MPKIQVKVNRYGDAKVEVLEATGSGCVEMTAGVEAALAGNAQNREYKPEYSEAEIEQTVENG